MAKKRETKRRTAAKKTAQKQTASDKRRAARKRASPKRAGASKRPGKQPKPKAQDAKETPMGVGFSGTFAPAAQVEADRQARGLHLTGEAGERPIPVAPAK